MCGIVGVMSQSAVNQLIYDALLLLQHRGQDAAGIVTMQGDKYFMHKARGMVHEALGALHGDDAGRILPTVLQQQQGVINQLVGGRLGDDADDAAHGEPWGGWRKVRR